GCGNWASSTSAWGGRGWSRRRCSRSRRPERRRGRRRVAVAATCGTDYLFGVDPNIEELIRAGREAYDRRDYGAALARFAKVLEVRPGFADIRNYAGLCLSMLGQPEAALAEFEQAVALNDGYIEAQLNRAITLNE